MKRLNILRFLYLKKEAVTSQISYQSMPRSKLILNSNIVSRKIAYFQNLSLMQSIYMIACESKQWRKSQSIQSLFVTRIQRNQMGVMLSKVVCKAVSYLAAYVDLPSQIVKEKWSLRHPITMRLWNILKAKTVDSLSPMMEAWETHEVNSVSRLSADKTFQVCFQTKNLKILKDPSSFSIVLVGLKISKVVWQRDLENHHKIKP